MAGHTGLVLFGKNGQRGLLIVTNPALFAVGLFGIERAYPVIVQTRLAVGFVASNTIDEFFPSTDLFIAVDAPIQIIHDIIVAIQTGIFAKEIRQTFVDICRIGVEPTVGNIPVAIQAGVFHVGRNVQLRSVYPPFSSGFCGPQTRECQNQQKKPAYLHKNILTTHVHSRLGKPDAHVWENQTRFPKDLIYNCYEFCPFRAIVWRNLRVERSSFRKVLFLKGDPPGC